MHALAMTVHAVLLAGGAPGGEAPAEIPSFHEGFNPGLCSLQTMLIFVFEGNSRLNICSCFTRN
ncbi:MAG: hypothetical protein WAU63_09760 [Methylovirgula sp.]